MRMVIEGLNIIRQMVWKQALDPILAAVLNRLIIIPAFESEHIQNFIHVCNFRLDGFPLLFQQFPAQRVCGCTLHAPVHKLLDVLDLKPRHFETFDHPQGFKLIYDYLSTHADGDRYAWAMVGFLLGNTVSANGSVSRGVCVTDASRNLVSVTERTCIEPYADGIHYSEDGGKSWADLPADCVVSMNLWGFTPAYVQEAKAGFAAFLQASLPVNPMKCEYYLPTVVTNALEAGKADVHVLTSADKWHGITYREDKPELVEALKKMSEDGLYPVDRLF